MFNISRITTFLAIIISCQLCFSQVFEKESILSDLEFLHQSLQQTHYNLFAYTSIAEFERNYRIVKESVSKDSLSLLEATTLFQKVISKANTGHAEIDFPATSYREYAMNGGTVFPLEIAVEEGKALIRKNFSAEEEIKNGSEVLAINEQSIEEVLNKIYPQLSAESTYFKNAKLEFWSFPRLYWQVFGQEDSFKISVRNQGEVKEFAIAAVDLINGYEMKRTDIISSDQFLSYYENTAYLKPGNFSGDENVYQQFIDSIFVDINKSRPDNLIVDLRNNTGGHNSFSDYLVSYIADKPFKWYSRFTLKSSKILKEQTRILNDTTDPYFKEILERKNGEIYEYFLDPYQPQEMSIRYIGNVYVLVNRHSYSMAAVTAAMIQDYDFATIVGEETGDFPTLYASQFYYTLPNTGIVVKVPKGYIIRVNGSEERTGVIPDIAVKDHLIDENDEILNSLLALTKPN